MAGYLLQSARGTTRPSKPASSPRTIQSN